MLTVHDLFAIPALSGSYLAGGAAGISRHISGVNIMEVPDIEDYLQSGELLLTTGYPLGGRTDTPAEFVVAMANRHLAAIAIKPRRFLSGLPEQMVQAADEWSLPLIVLPDDVSFNSVIASVLAAITDSGAPGLPRGSAIQEHLTAIALAGGGLRAISRTLSTALHRAVHITDAAGAHFDADCTSTPDLDQAQSWPITVAGRQRGQVLVEGMAPLTTAQTVLVEHARFAAGMHMAQQMAQQELDRRQHVLYLEELVSGTDFDSNRYTERARLLGWPTGQVAIVLANTRYECDDDAVGTAGRSILGPDSQVWVRGREVVALISAPDGERQVSQLTRWHQVLVATGGREAAVAHGRVVSDPRGLATSHASAREGLTIAKASDRAVVRYSELTLERLLLAVTPAVLTELVDREIGTLVDYDRQTGSQLCRTLQLYLSTGSAAAVARDMFIHYNTMKYRLGRIRSLIGDIPRDPRGRIALLLALEANTLRARTHY